MESTVTHSSRPGAAVTRAVQAVRNGEVQQIDDRLVAEAPLEIRLEGVPLAVLMRTPGTDEDLVRGFLLSEGIVLRPGEVGAVAPAPGDPEQNRWDVTLSDGVTVDATRFQRNVYTSSSCGVCGKASIDAVRVAAAVPGPGPRVERSVLAGLGSSLREHQRTFDETGGLHAAGAFTPDGTLLALCEDIGRHNAVDKLIGGLSRRHWPLQDLVLMVSGRISFEIVQKAAVAGLAFVCGVSAASSLAVELGEEMGMTVVGFLRDGDFNLYSGQTRVTL